jgi:Uma2 family endonuclease
MAAGTARAILGVVSSPTASSLRHVRAPLPLRFPAEEPEWERMPESTRHHALCEALYQILRRVVPAEHTVAADAFVYFDAADAGRKLAPDAFVKLGVAQHDFESYLAWERGTPELAFEVLSPSDSPEKWTFEEKLVRYRALGVRELVVFHADGAPGERLRVWDRLEHDLVERIVDGERTPCLTLGLMLIVGPVEHYPAGLRLARDEGGRDLVLTSDEAASHAERARDDAERARDDAERARDDAERARDDAERARDDAEARAARLDAELRALRGEG